MKKILVAIVIIIILAPIIYVGVKKYSNAPLGSQAAAATKIPVVKVLTPNSGGSYADGSNLLITWEASEATSVDIRLWNSQTGNIDIATNLPNNGSYMWKVKASNGYSGEYAISVRGNNRLGSSYDSSDMNFKITSGPTSTLILTSPAVQIVSSNHYINTTDGVTASLMQFTGKSERGDSKLTSLTAVASGTVPTTLSLYDGSTLLSSKSVPSNRIVKFDNLSSIIPKDVSKTYIIKASYATNAASGGSVVLVTDATYEASNGSLAALSSLNIMANVQYLFPAVANFTLSSQPASIVVPGADGNTARVTTSFPITISAKGGTVALTQIKDVTAYLVGPNGTRYPAGAISVVTNPNTPTADGSSASLMIQSAFVATGLPPFRPIYPCNWKHSMESWKYDSQSNMGT